MVFSRVVLLVMFLAGALAVPVAAPAGAAQPSTQEAASFVKSLADRAINTVATPNLPDSEREQRFRQLFVSNFDLEAISRFVLGRYWRKAAVEDQKEFLKLFEDVTVMTWSGRFKDYQGQTLAVGSVRPAPENEVFVDTTVNQKEGPPLTVVWRLTQGDRGFRVVDLVVEGVSMALTYRSEYTAVLQRSGGDITALLNALRNKVNELSIGGPIPASGKP